MKPTNTRNQKTSAKNETATQWRATSPVEYEKDGEKQTYWQDLGTGFQTKSGIMFRLNALPTNGKIFISEKTERQVE